MSMYKAMDKGKRQIGNKLGFKSIFKAHNLPRELSVISEKKDLENRTITAGGLESNPSRGASPEFVGP